LEFLLLDMIATEKRRQPLNEAYIESIRSMHSKLAKEEFLDYLLEGIESNRADGMNHVNWFNFEKIKDLLLANGFGTVRLSAFGRSYHPPMQEVPLFDGWLPRISLYVEAEK
jgi:hypothetical protein